MEFSYSQGVKSCKANRVGALDPQLQQEGKSEATCAFAAYTS
jgi:hypothetical protein